MYVKIEQLLLFDVPFPDTHVQHFLVEPFRAGSFPILCPQSAERLEVRRSDEIYKFEIRRLPKDSKGVLPMHIRIDGVLDFPAPLRRLPEFNRGTIASVEEFGPWIWYAL